MEVKMEKQDWMFLLLCLVLGVAAEEAFFRAQVGISYLVFIAVFYIEAKVVPGYFLRSRNQGQMKNHQCRDHQQIKSVEGIKIIKIITRSQQPDGDQHQIAKALV